MLQILIRKKGQGIISEHVFMIVLVAISIMVMSTYIRRALQARYRDGNRMVYMKASAALGNAVLGEYEPYYVNTSAETEVRTMLEESADMRGVVDKTSTLQRKQKSQSVQKPF
jgi:hypothetical protein